MQPWVMPTIAATLFYGIWGLLPKYSTRHIPTASAFIYTNIGLLTVGFAVLCWLRFSPDYDLKGIAIAGATGVLGFTGMFTYIQAADRGPVTLVSVVTSLYPVPTVLIAYVWLGETPTALQSIGLLLSVPAIILLVK